MKPGKRRRRGSKYKRLDDQIKRAALLAVISSGPVAELYLLHKQICEEKRGSARRR